VRLKTNSSIHPWLTLLFLILVWHVYAIYISQSHWLLPPPIDVCRVFITHHELLWHHLAYTLKATLWGFGISTISGVFVAILLDWSALLRKALYPFLVVSQTVPILAIAPLIIVWMGYGISSKIFTVSLICFFPITVNLYDGFKQVSVEYIRLLQAMNATSWQIFRNLKLPAALPNLFTGLKLSATYSVMGAVIGEMLGGYAGLGIYLGRATKSFQTAQVFAIIIVIILVSLLIFLLISLLERVLLAYHFSRIAEYEDLK